MRTIHSQRLLHGKAQEREGKASFVRRVLWLSFKRGFRTVIPVEVALEGGNMLGFMLPGGSEDLRNRHSHKSIFPRSAVTNSTYFKAMPMPCGFYERLCKNVARSACSGSRDNFGIALYRAPCVRCCTLQCQESSTGHVCSCQPGAKCMTPTRRGTPGHVCHPGLSRREVVYRWSRCSARAQTNRRYHTYGSNYGKWSLFGAGRTST